MENAINKILEKYTTISIDEIREHYREEHRYFHIFSHIEDLLGFIFEHRKLLTDQEFEILVLAALFHDIFYSPLSDKNEELSALYLYDKSINKEDITIKKVYDIIINTKEHSSSERLSAYFNRIDMDIVYCDDLNKLKDWENKIRKEYSVYSDDVYKKGRIEFLKKYTKLNPKIKDLLEYVKSIY